MYIVEFNGLNLSLSWERKEGGGGEWGGQPPKPPFLDPPLKKAL